MAEDFLEEIYEDSLLLFELKKEVELAREGDASVMVRKLNELFPKIANVCNKIAQYDYESGLKLWNSLDKNMDYDGDLIALADRFERFLIPDYQNYLKTMNGISVDDGKGICFLSSDAGFLTMYLTTEKRYIHSIFDPMWEAYIQAKQMFRFEKTDYYFIGAGLGYLPYQIYQYSEGLAKIHIFESEERLVEYGQKYGVLDWIPEENINISIIQDVTKLMEEISKETSAYCICEKLISGMQDEKLHQLTNMSIKQGTQIRLEKLTKINYISNLRNINKTIADFDEKRFKNEVVIVAGGPSVDDRMEYLKEIQGKKTILASGTIFSKLMKNNIVPDAIVVLDPLEDTLKQFDGWLDETIPLFMREDTYKGFGIQYKGEKYMALGPLSYEAKLEGKLSPKLQKVPFIQTGSSVTIFAAYLAVFYGAKRIELIGADFAYPGNETHAKDTPDYRKMDLEGEMKVKGVRGNMVNTDRLLWFYLEQMEELINLNPNIEFYNLTTAGAEIKGAVWKHD